MRIVRAIHRQKIMHADQDILRDHDAEDDDHRKPDQLEDAAIALRFALFDLLLLFALLLELLFGIALDPFSGIAVGVGVDLIILLFPFEMEKILVLFLELEEHEINLELDY